MSKRRNDKIKDLVKRGLIADQDHKARQAIGFQSNIAGTKNKQRWVKGEVKPEPLLYDYKKSKQGVKTKRKYYNVFDNK